jgi:hypothetical protein
MERTNKKLIAVAGATGQQGGAVVRALQASNQCKVSALTRNPAQANHRLFGFSRSALGSIAVPLSGAVVIAGGLSILLGYGAKLGAWLIVPFLIPVMRSWIKAEWITSPQRPLRCASSRDLRGNRDVQRGAP